MNNAFENENKNKTSQEDSEVKSLQDETEPMENSLGMEEESSTEIEVPSFAFSLSSVPVNDVESKLADEETAARTVEERRQILAREKWLSVTGRKPQNIPTVRRYLKSEGEKPRIEFFGERRPAQIEKERKQKWIQRITNEVYKKAGTNNGVLLKEQDLPYTMESLWCLRFHPNGKNFSTGFRNGGVQVRDPLTCETILNLTTLESAEKLPLRTLRYYPPDPSKLYAAGASGNLQMFDLESESFYDMKANLSQINIMDFNVDGTVLVTGGRNGIVSIIDPANLKVISMKIRPVMDDSIECKVNDDFHRLRVYGAKFHPNEPYVFLTGGWDRIVKIWDVRVPGPVRSINGPFICGDAIDMNGNTILTASWTCENSIQLWDFLSGSLMNTVQIQTKATKFDGEFLYVAQFCKDGSEEPSNSRLIAVGGSGFNELAIVKIPCGKIIASFPAYKAVTCLDTCGPYVAYGGKESLLRLGRINLSKKY